MDYGVAKVQGMPRGKVQNRCPQLDMFLMELTRVEVYRFGVPIIVSKDREVSFVASSRSEEPRHGVIEPLVDSHENTIRIISVGPLSTWQVEALKADFTANLGRSPSTIEILRFIRIVRHCAGTIPSDYDFDDDLLDPLDRSDMSKREIHTSSTADFQITLDSKKLGWVDTKALGMTCWYSFKPTLELAFRHVTITHPDHSAEWELVSPGEDDRIYSQSNTHENLFVSTYMTLFDDLGVRLPFFNFEVRILQFLQVAPLNFIPTPKALSEALSSYARLERHYDCDGERGARATMVKKSAAKAIAKALIAEATT
ncbi:hypothetical protein SESBI_40134 [Sesbania bispinosa]|nr:hypothetical protein SESBI_40134 [Sesbania bispinosa]